QALAAPAAQRELLDAFGGFTTLTREVGAAWRAWQAAAALRDAAAGAAEASATQRAFLDARKRELPALAVTEQEWTALNGTQSRLAHAATLLETATAGAEALTESDDAIASRLAQLRTRLAAAAAHDPAMAEIAALLDPAAIQVDEAARALR